MRRLDAQRCFAACDDRLHEYCRGMITPGESSAPTLLATHGVQQLPSNKLELFQMRGFLDDAICAELIAMIETERRPSTLADANGDDYFRTSETCDLAPEVPMVQAEGLETKLFALSGIDPAHGEPVQGQRYAVGQEFKAHCDWFKPWRPGLGEVLLGLGPANLDLHDLSQRCRSWRRNALQGGRQDGPAGDRQAAMLEQPQAGPATQSQHDPPWHEGSKGRQIRDHQMVSGEALGLVTRYDAVPWDGGE